MNSKIEYINEVFHTINMKKDIDLNIYIISLEQNLSKMQNDENTIQIKGCEIPIDINTINNEIKIYTRSRVMRGYIFIVLILYINKINWQDFFRKKRLYQFITSSREKGISKLIEYLDTNKDKDIISSNINLKFKL